MWKAKNFLAFNIPRKLWKANPRAIKASREVTKLTKRKILHTPVVKEVWFSNVSVIWKFGIRIPTVVRLLGATRLSITNFAEKVRVPKLERRTYVFT